MADRISEPEASVSDKAPEHAEELEAIRLAADMGQLLSLSPAYIAGVLHEVQKDFRDLNQRISELEADAKQWRDVRWPEQVALHEHAQAEITELRALLDEATCPKHYLHPYQSHRHEGCDWCQRTKGEG